MIFCRVLKRQHADTEAVLFCDADSHWSSPLSVLAALLFDAGTLDDFRGAFDFRC